MPLTLNRYSADHLQFFSLKNQTIAGTDYEVGDEIEDALEFPKLEMMVRTRRIVPVTTDRNLQPKMFYRELRSPEFVEAKYGFLPELAAGVADDYDPSDHTQAEVEAFVDDYPDTLGQILVAEAEGRARSGLLTALQTLAADEVVIDPDTDVAAGGAEVEITGDSIIIALGECTGVKFASTNGTAFDAGEGGITVTAPAHAAGAVNVTLVGFPGGDLVLTGAFTYTA